jgi:hypothetical protein
MPGENPNMLSLFINNILCVLMVSKTKKTNGTGNKRAQSGREVTEALSPYIQFLLCVLCGKS